MTPRALLSVSDKTGIVELARELAAAGIELVSTGGTATTLREAGLDVLDAADVTGQPEVMGGRVKTMHPRIMGGMLARRDVDGDMDALIELGGAPIDWVIVNLYPFRDTIARPGVTPPEAIEQIDIGGPTLVRSAAKNHAHVVVAVDPTDYPRIARAAAGAEPLELEDRARLAAKAFRHTAAYDAVIADYLSAQAGETFPETLTITLDKVQDLRYGENPHQPAAFYAHPVDTGIGTLVDAAQHQGKELSYNNIADADAALAIVREFDAPAAVIVKHVNPCGVATGADALEAWTSALAADPVSAFGGIVALNRPVDAQLAHQLCTVFLEVVIAPGYDEDALRVLATKENLRVLELDVDGPGSVDARHVASTVSGGMLLQQADVGQLTREQLDVVTKSAPTDEQLEDLLFGWRVVKHVSSNAVVLAGGGRTLGIGAGQMNRVGAAKIAIEAAGDQARGSVLASDAFFPMPDSIELAASAGITAIIQPGGSKRDPEVVAACDRLGISMVFTGVRHFRH
jgi:phosphoribosylaminoimidazolecarboxamide formyltransferase/IMP cyclohydrolase